MNAKDLAQQLEDMRRYTKMVLDGIKEEDCFRFPDGCPTHIGWQLGHCAIAEYGLVLKSVRGELETDKEFVPSNFPELFGRGSKPLPAGECPSMSEIIKAFDAVHRQVVEECVNFSPELLSEKVSFEHPLFETKMGAIVWCAHHEMTHAGQITLIRRLLGYEIRF